MSLRSPFTSGWHCANACILLTTLGYLLTASYAHHTSSSGDRALPTPLLQARSHPRDHSEDVASVFFAESPLLPLGAAIVRSDLKAMTEIIATGIDLNQTGRSGITPLMWALILSREEAVNCLLAHGASPDIALTEPVRFSITYVSEGDTFLLAAAKLRKYGSLYAALDYTRKPNQVDRNGSTFLQMYLALPFVLPFDGDPLPIPNISAKLERMIDIGADVNAQDAHGNTAVHVALRFNAAYIPLLLERGGDPCIENDFGFSVLNVITSAMGDREGLSEAYRPIADWLIRNGYLDPNRS